MKTDKKRNCDALLRDGLAGAGAVRHFTGVGDSLVNHFVSKTRSRLEPNDGRRQFLRKWGIPAKTFQELYLHPGEDFSGAPEEPSGPRLALAKAKNWLEGRVS